MSEGEGEGDQHQGEDEAEEKEPNVEFLLSPGAETETISCVNFPGLTGPLYPHVLRGEFLFLSVATSCPSHITMSSLFQGDIYNTLRIYQNKNLFLKLPTR